MKIFVIAAKIEAEETPWIINAWDEWTVDANYAGWEDAIKEAQEKVGPKTEVRVGEVKVPNSFLFDMFKNHSVEGKVGDEAGR